MTSVAVEILLPAERPMLVLASEAAYVTETPTGLSFAADTPLEILGPLIVRLVREEKRIQWAIGDAINFGETNFPGMYEQWVEETGLSENTLSTMRWVAERIDPLRRRKDVGWSHHREVAALPAPVQDRLLDRAADKGMTRWEVRQAAKVEREKIEDRAATPEPASDDDAEVGVWVPQRYELTDDARLELERRLAGMGKSYRIGYERAWLDCLLFTDQREMFIEWRGPV